MIFSIAALRSCFIPPSCRLKIYSCQHRPKWNVDLLQGSDTPMLAAPLDGCPACLHRSIEHISRLKAEIQERIISRIHQISNGKNENCGIDNGCGNGRVGALLQSKPPEFFPYPWGGTQEAYNKQDKAACQIIKTCRIRKPLPPIPNIFPI